MNSKTILQKIVDENGSCEWIQNSSICDKCPLRRWKRREPKGHFYSCTDAVLGVDVINLEDADQRFKEAAGRLLSEIALEEAVKQSDGS